MEDQKNEINRYIRTPAMFQGMGCKWYNRKKDKNIAFQIWLFIFSASRQGNHTYDSASLFIQVALLVRYITNGKPQNHVIRNKSNTISIWFYTK